MPTWKNKQHIAIWGFGKEGRSAYVYLCKKAPQAVTTILLDTNEPCETPASVNVLRCEEAWQAITSGQFDLIIKSPGISLYRPEIKIAESCGTEFTSASNLWFEEHPKAQTLVITGTKGKSTTAALLHHLLTQEGIPCTLSGNIGHSLLDLKPRGLNIIELSSYQIADLQHAPTMVLFTNLFPEHATWHQNHENYYRDKTRIAMLSEHTRIFANGDNETLKETLKNALQVTWYQKSNVMPDMPTHVQYTLGGITSVLERLGYPIQRFLLHITTFSALPHRLQEVGTTPHGVLCVNDSISTIPEATLAALNVYQERPIMLILGGEDRGQDYTKLIKPLKNLNIRHIFTLPEISEPYLAALAKVAPLSMHKDLKNAVSKALEVAKNGDVLLLSPAAPSYNQFSNFEERGNLFNQLCGF